MTNPDQGPEQDKAVQLLRNLGLTSTEAAVYCTALQTCAEEPLSSYKLAQAMGRDPANVAKTLSALVRLQAMTVVQDKPRLYLPAAPAEFTERVLTRMQHNGRQAVDLLQQMHAPRPAGMTLALAGAEQVFARARALLAECRERALVFGSKEALREIGAELEALGESGERTVRVLSPLAMVSDNVEIAVFSPLSDLAALMTHEFLQLVVDDRAWLSAVLDEEAGAGPLGWWGDRSAMAAVLGGSLNLAWQAGHSPRTAVAPAAAPPPEPAPPAADPAPEPSPAAPADEEEFEEGLTFLMRHDDHGDKEKGER